MAKEHLKDKAPITYLNNTVRLEYIENTGAAMSLGDGLSDTTAFWLLGILPLVSLSGLFIYSIRKSADMRFGKMLSFALIFSGGIGNIIDRLMYQRHVTDFMMLDFGTIRTGIFNFADVCVTAGAIGLLFFYKNTTIKNSVQESGTI